MPAGPCRFCGLTNYARSLGGDDVCPWCDCGNFGGGLPKKDPEYYGPKLSETTTSKMDKLMEGLRTDYKRVRAASESSPDGPRDEVFRQGQPVESTAESVDLTIFTLPELCMHLHTSLWGAGDPWPDEDRTKVVAYLRQRLRDWRPSASFKWTLFDESVRLMVLAVLHEVVQYESERAAPQQAIRS